MYKKISSKISWFQICRLRNSSISVFRSVTGRDKNGTWLPLFMLFYRWSCIVDFILLNLWSMNLLYLRHHYLLIWFLSMSMLYQYICISDWWHNYMGMIYLFWSYCKLKLSQHLIISWKKEMVWTSLVMWNSLTGAYV